VISLGYGVCEWIADVLSLPGDPSRPFVLTNEQARFVVRLLEVDDRGRFTHRHGLLMMPKGWGKSPVGAALSVAFFCGPVCFDGWDAAGEPVGRAPGTGGTRPPWVQIAAVSEDQAASNTYSLVWEMLSSNDGSAATTLGVDAGKTRLFLKAQPGAKLEPVTSSHGSRAGQRVSFGLFDESNLWTPSNGGERLARTIRANTAKTSGMTLETANAFELGARSVAEQTFRAREDGQFDILTSFNRPSMQPTPAMDDAELLELLREAYGDSTWLDLERILAEVRDPAMPWAESSRLFFNLASAGAEAFIDPARWEVLVTDDEPAQGSRVAIAFLGASTNSAALILCDSEPRLRVLDIWEGDYMRQTVDAAVRSVFERYDVGAFYVDPRSWRTEAERWADAFGDRVIAFPTNSPRRMAPALDRFRVAVEEGQVHHDGDEDLARHVTNARFREGRNGHMLEEQASRPITACVAAVMALEAEATMPDPAAVPPVMIEWSEW
jgi:hypothetical protein